MDALGAAGLLALLDYYENLTEPTKKADVLGRFHEFLMESTYKDTPELAIERLKHIAHRGKVF